MIFGDRNHFAIAIELDTDYGGAWLFGKLCYWIDGQQFGDWELGNSMRDALWSITSIAKDNGRRENCKLFHLPMQQAFDRINATLRGKLEQAHDELAESADYHDVVVKLNIFNDYEGFLIDCEKRARLIYRGPSPRLKEVILRRGEFDAVILATHTQLNAWYEREVPDAE